MTNFIITPNPLPSIELEGSDKSFPVNRVFCVGRNYAAHAREMGANPEREPPFFFNKPADTVLSGKSVNLSYPPRTADLHYEVELVIALASGGANISTDQALDLVFGAGVGIDFTRRDLQADAKAMRRPWDMGKGFDGSAVVSPLSPFNASNLPSSGRIELEVNGETRQSGDLNDMIWSTADIIAELSTYLTLQPGDLIFTGTPDGVGPVNRGDRITAKCAGVSNLIVDIG